MSGGVIQMRGNQDANDLLCAKDSQPRGGGALRSERGNRERGAGGGALRTTRASAATCSMIGGAVCKRCFCDREG
jgi:hypothetical protein